MILGKCRVTNFGSYGELEFDFSSQDLALIHGPTGAGKSTLADVPCWIMFGETAKGGAVDEIRAWQAPKAPTTGYIEIILPDGELLSVTRIRGKAGENDLWWTENGLEPKRGKDLSDTQKLLEERLGVSADIYQSAAYFHEFSQSGAFFTSKAKDRRAVFEGIADLEFPGLLCEALQSKRQVSRKTHADCDDKLQRLLGGHEATSKSLQRHQHSSDAWGSKHLSRFIQIRALVESTKKEEGARKEKLKEESAAWEREKNKDIEEINKEIESLTDPWEDVVLLKTQWDSLRNQLDEDKGTPCPTCGAPEGAAANAAVERQLWDIDAQLTQYRHREKAVLDLNARLKKLTSKVNPYEANILLVPGEVARCEAALREVESEVNPFLDQITIMQEQLEATELEIVNKTKQVDNLNHEIVSLGLLLELCSDLRGILLHKAVANVENSTNCYLEKYFDAEIRVKFTLEGSDSLKVDLQKSGYACTYTQLSKGQRGLLKLCFVLSIMDATSNRHGVHLNAVFLDESLDGLDSNLKLKAFGLFQELSRKHESVFVIDHEEGLKQLFDKRYEVSLESDHSVLQLQES